MSENPQSPKSSYREVIIAGSISLLAVLVILFAFLFFQGVFNSEEIISASVTYDADPYNMGKCDPHTYAITDAEDIAFLTEILKDLERFPGGGNCGYKQVVLNVVYSDGREVDYYPAGDSCPSIAKNNPDHSENHFTLPVDRLYEFRQRISKYIPELQDGRNAWLEAVG